MDNVPLRAEKKVLQSAQPTHRKTFAHPAAKHPPVQPRAVKQSPETTKKVHTMFISNDGKSSKEVQCLLMTLVSPARHGIKVKKMYCTPKMLSW